MHEALARFPDYFLNYSTPYLTYAQYRQAGNVEQVVLEIRKGARAGCILFTKIMGKTYRLQSSLARGALHDLVATLPIDGQLIIRHEVLIDVADTASSLTVLEILAQSQNLDLSKPMLVREDSIPIQLACTFEGKDFQTDGNHNIFEAVNELVDKMSTERKVRIRLCFFCRYVYEAQNSMICLRDLSTETLSTIKSQGKHALSGLLAGAAWNLDDFHYCDSFMPND